MSCTGLDQPRWQADTCFFLRLLALLLLVVVLARIYAMPYSSLKCWRGNARGRLGVSQACRNGLSQGNVYSVCKDFHLAALN